MVKTWVYIASQQKNISFREVTKKNKQKKLVSRMTNYRKINIWGKLMKDKG